jgi:STE24 endopeptidase
VLLGFALLGWLAREPGFYAAFGVSQTPAMALLLFAFVVPPFIFFATPLGSWWSRRQELAADDYAVQHSNAADLVTALVKLYRDNATALTPDRVHSAFYDSHPSAAQRIARLQAAPQSRAAMMPRAAQPHERTI